MSLDETNSEMINPDGKIFLISMALEAKTKKKETQANGWSIYVSPCHESTRMKKKMETTLRTQCNETQVEGRESGRFRLRYSQRQNIEWINAQFPRD
jgi:hypothetical protein